MSKVSMIALKIFRRIVWIAFWWIEHILQICFFIPVKRNRVLFVAGDGLQYCCNPKYISEYLVNISADVDIIWGFYHPRKYKNIPEIKAVRIFSLAWFYYTATASTVITNTSVQRAQPKRKGQLIIETWHGGGAYKCVGSMNKYATSSLESRIRKEFVQKIDLFVSSSKVFTENTIRREHGYEGEVLCSGLPRNDLFFDEIKRTTIAKRIRDTLGVTGFVALYAPTFRGEFVFGHGDEDTFPYRKVLSALQERFGRTVTVLKRAHPGRKMTGKIVEGVVDVTDYPDIQELLCAADLLITDYSSSIWDYSLMKRPCLLYMPDLEEYLRNRG